MRAQGFTLLELLIAISIFALMSVMAYGGLAAVIQTRDSVGKSMDRLSEVQKAIYRLQADIEGSQARPVRTQYGDVDPAMRLEVDGLGLYLTRSGWRNPLSLPRSSLQRVFYRLEEKQLKRRSWPILDGMAPDGLQEDSYREVVLLKNIEDIRWRFLADLPASGEDFDDLQWLENWPTLSDEPDDSSLPRAVELLLTSEHWGEIRYLFRINPGMAPKPVNASADGGADEDEPPPEGDPTDPEDESENDNNGETPPNGGNDPSDDESPDLSNDDPTGLRF